MECKCGNPTYGFDCTCEWETENSGDKSFCCEFCGLYKASRARCTECEELGEDKDYLHLSKWYFRSYPTGAHFKDGAYCGHGSFHARITSDLSKVTCPKCIEKIPEVWRKKYHG